ncbi:uncharacterized protein METZ01_LOCUS405679, partial [marine metagenome]
NGSYVNHDVRKAPLRPTSTNEMPAIPRAQRANDLPHVGR